VDALSGTRNVWIRYLSSPLGEITDGVVTPKEIVGTGSAGTGGTLVAFCHTARNDRNFRIDRILDLRLMEQSV
jgi:predicted DNA-binding transcriptional regulator YafY